MARPPKSSTRKPIPTKSAVSGTKAGPAEAAKAIEKPAKSVPFVTEPQSASLKAAEPVVAAPAPLVAAEPVATPEVSEPVAEPIAAIAPAPVETVPEEAVLEKSTPVETPLVMPSTPSQPVVAEPLAAAIESVALWQTPQVLEGNHIMNEAIETTKKFAEDAKTRVQSMLAEMNDKAKVAMEKSSKALEEIGDITKGNLEAVVESSKIAAKGFESFGQNAAEYGRISFEKTSATFKSFASVKSPAEFLQLQSELVTSTFDALASESAKTSEAVLKLAGEIAQPISSRVAVVSDKFKALAA